MRLRLFDRIRRLAQLRRLPAEAVPLGFPVLRAGIAAVAAGPPRHRVR